MVDIKTSIEDTRLYDYIMVVFMIAGSIIAALIGFTIMNMVYGYSLTIPYDPDFLLYKNNTAVWGEEIDYYGQKLNQSMYPLCCHEWGEGQVWGDTRK